MHSCNLKIFESLTDVIEQHAQLNPDKIALIFGNRHLTYFDLHCKVEQLALYILDYVGRQQEATVCLAFERSLDLIIGILATLKAGAIYIPLDPQHPKQRLDFILNDIQPALLLMSLTLKEQFKDFHCTQICYDEIKSSLLNLKNRHLGVSERWPVIHPDQLAYILYTSGSTGQPKGVMISHFNLLNFLNSITPLLPLLETDRFLSVTTPSFDISILEYFGTLMKGGTLIIAPSEVASEASSLLKLIQEQNITIMQATPLTWQMLLEADWQPTMGFKILCGGEALPLNLFKKLLAHPVLLWNLYGPTETTIWSTGAQYTSEDKDNVISMGHPIGNTQIHLIDCSEEEVSSNSPKEELCISGAGLARGYWNRPGLTSEKFMPNPAGDSQLYIRLYHTGDVAEKLQDGSFKYLGRIDHQVKVRGYRIELEEIEFLLNQHIEIQRAIIHAELTHDGYHRLVAYVIAQNKQIKKAPWIKKIKASLLEQLPEYMVPSTYRFLEAFPITANGKVDRKRLAESKLIEEFDRSSERQLSFLEDLLSKICTDIVHIKDIDIEDDLFGLGLDSLGCLRVSVKLKCHGFNVSERMIFSCKTIRNLASYIEKSNNQLISKTFPIIERQTEQTSVVSLAQQRLWLMDQLLPCKGQYNLGYAFRIKGTIDLPKFEEAVINVIFHHETFRTIFLEKDGEVFQHILDEKSFRFNIENIGEEQLPNNQSITQFLTEETKKPFDLSSPPLFRLYLIKISPLECIFSLVIHHILIDEWSIDLLFHEIKERYQNPDHFNKSPPLPIQYADFSAWQRNYIRTDQILAQSTFWKNQLTDIIHDPLIHTDHKRSKNSGYHTAQLTHLIPPHLTLLLQRTIVDANATLFMTLASLLNIFFYRYSNRPHIVIGAPVANRHYPEVKNLLGFLVNLVALKSSLNDEMSFLEVLLCMRDTVLDAYENQDLPFEEVVRNLKTKHALGVHPIFQVILILESPHQKLRLEGLDVDDLRLELTYNNPSPFDLTLWARETKKGLELRFEYAEELFDKETMRWFGTHIENIIAAVTANPKEKICNIPLFSFEQLARKIHTGSTYFYSSEDGVIERLERHAIAWPSKVSTIFQDQHLSYEALLSHVNHLANHLIYFAAQIGDPICVLCERSNEFLISILAILKIGAVYIPIDPKLPSDRIQSILSSCRPRLILTNFELKHLCEKLAPPGCVSKVIAELLLASPKQSPPLMPFALPANRLAYIIFTSGSTGIPKGVMVEHDGMINHLHAKISDLNLTSQDIIAQTATQAFDISIWQFLVGVFVGGTTWICATEEFWNPKEFLPSLIKHQVTIAETVPSHIFMLLDAIQENGCEIKSLSLRNLLSTGEPLHASLARRWFNFFSHIPITNAYGPTECSDDVTHYTITAENENLNDLVPISGVVTNTSLYFLDSNYNLTPQGGSSELGVGGRGVGRGYLNDPEKTAIAFLPDLFSPKAGSRMYLTGDGVRENSKNEILFLGRLDSQVKVRGYRIELEEIESQLESHKDVKRVKTVLLNPTQHDTKVIAYVVPDCYFLNRQQQQNFISKIREFLFNKLPSYMIPSYFVLMKDFPLNINGKVDVKQLPRPQENDDSVPTPPRNFIEYQLSQLLKKILKKNQIDIFDNIFDLGANSLLAITLSAEIRKYFNSSISILDVFKYPTVIDLAKCITTSEGKKNSVCQIHSCHQDSPSLFLMHASDGLTFAYSNLILKGLNFSIYCLNNPQFGQKNLKFTSLEEMAVCYMDQITALQPEGPYYLGGWSFGGNLSFEIASRLHALGKKVGHVFLIDSFASFAAPSSFIQEDVDEILEKYGIKRGTEESQLFSREMANNHTLLDNYQPTPGELAVTLFKALEPTKYLTYTDPDNGWKNFVSNLKRVDIPTNHYDIFSSKESLEIIAKTFIQTIC